MSYTISARGASGRYMPETTENERFWASLCAKNRKRPPKWAPKITENDPPWHISSKGIFGGPVSFEQSLPSLVPEVLSPGPSLAVKLDSLASNTLLVHFESNLALLLPRGKGSQTDNLNYNPTRG